MGWRPRILRRNRPRAQDGACHYSLRQMRAALRGGDFEVSTGGSCHGIVNPIIDVQPWLPHSVSSANYGYYEDPKELAIYDKWLHETDLKKQKALALQFNKQVLD